MPIYDYHCDHCGHTFSQVQSYVDATLEVCPSCGKKPRKLMTTPAIVFKGGGWYKTDSRAPQKDASSEGAKPSGDTAAAGADKDKKAEPAAKTETAKSDAPKAAPAAPAAPAAKKGDTAS